MPITFRTIVFIVSILISLTGFCQAEVKTLSENQLDSCIAAEGIRNARFVDSERSQNPPELNNDLPIGITPSHIHHGTVGSKIKPPEPMPPESGHIAISHHTIEQPTQAPIHLPDKLSVIVNHESYSPAMPHYPPSTGGMSGVSAVD
ncbi:hypothetical protein [Desulfoluna spongiiphila]|uniref:hypothetical protein n=1 Tax=Desulfoluna spongiiphila TaxID=419481 RepID=UPI00125FFC4B|nr:hypothetical protein [Desulfoluna spongiiphila]